MNQYNLDGIDIPFDPTWKKVAVSLSGGADSTLLLYLLCKLITDTRASTEVHVISHTRMWKTRPWQSWDSKNVYDYITVRHLDIKFVRHTNFIAPDIEYGFIGPTIKDEYGRMVSGDNIQQRAYAEYICHYQNIEAYYNGITRNPKGIDLGGMLERDLDPTDDNQHLTVMKHMNKWALHPFRFVDKAWVVKQYKRLRIQKLFDITRSCEGEFEGIDYTTYQPGQVVPTCGECFWCKERTWAIEQNK